MGLFDKQTWVGPCLGNPLVRAFNVTPSLSPASRP